MAFEDIPFLQYLGNAVDILLVWYVIYKLIMVIRGTKAVQLLKGIVVIVLVRMASQYLGLSTLQWLMDQAITWGFLAIIIIFQPELRRALEQLGRGRFFSRSGTPVEEAQQKTIEAITKAINYMAKRRIGALLTIERDTGMGDYIETGIPLNAKVSSELLIDHINLLGRSIIFVGLFFIAEVWLMSVSCARTVKKMKRVYVLVFLLMLGIYSICLYRFFFLQHSSGIWESIARFISGVGLVFDTLSPLYVVVFIGIITVSFMTIAFTSRQVEMKESLVKEAEFWEEFQERQFGSGQIIQKPKTTWWGLQGLNGIWSFLWLELLLFKKYLFFHSIHTVMLSGVFYVVIFMYPEWFYLLFFLIVSAVMLSSYYSGIVRHSQSGTLHLFPGALWKKIIILELTNTVWLYILYCVSITFMAVGNLVYWYIYGLGIYIWFMTIRLFAFTHTNRNDIKLSLPQYYKSFFMALGLSGICLYVIHLLTADWYTLVVVVCIGSLSWCLFYRFR